MDVQQSLETSHSKSSLGSIQHQYLAKLLVNVYSHCLMVKSLSCCCVCGSWLFIDLVTISHLQFPLPKNQWVCFWGLTITKLLLMGLISMSKDQQIMTFTRLYCSFYYEFVVKDEYLATSFLLC